MKKTFKGTLALAFCIVTVFATMLIASAISAPKVKVKSVTYNTVTISWATVKGADGGYEVQRSTDGKKWKTLTKSTKSKSYTDKKLTTGKTYRYRVRAIDKGLFKNTYSSYSKVVKGKPVPAKVKTVKASPTHNSVKLSWSKVSGASGYVVERYSSKKWKAIKTTSKTSLTVSKLSLGKTYNFRVRAYKTVSKKKIYGAYSSTIKTGPVLKAPSSVVLNGVSTSTLKLSWSAVTGAKGYEVYNAATKKWTNTKTKRTLTVSKLKAGTKYSFYVRAYAGSYDGPKSATYTFVTAPAKVSGVKVTSSSTNSLTFTWSKTAGAAGYQPSYYNHSTKKWTNLSTTTGTSATVTGLTHGTKYTVRVRAFNKNSNVKDISATSYGSWSSEISASTSILAPASISLTSVNTSSIKISWAASQGATSYKVYNSKTNQWASTGTSRSYTLSGLSAGTKYSFKVKAVLDGKDSPESKTYSFITAPAAPSGLKCSTATINGVIESNSTASSITVSWNKVTGATKYQVQYSADGKTWTSAPETTSTTATVSGLKAGTAYSIRVRAYVKNGNTPAYGAYTTTTARTRAAKITANTASGTNSINLTWNAVSNAKGYIVERFDSLQAKDWTVFDFSDNKFKAYDKLDADSIIMTTETTVSDSPAASRAEIYRVYVVDKNNYLSEPSDIVIGDTADIDVSVTDYYAEIKITAYDNVSTYSINSYYPFIMYNCTTYNVSSLTKEGNKYIIKVALAPDSINSFTVVAHDASGKTLSGTGLITVSTKPLKIVSSTSDANYNASVNSQLLYVAQAINNTKNYTGKITAQLSSTINTKCGSLEIFQNGKRNKVLEFFLGSLLDDELSEDIKEEQNYTFTFENGEYKDEKNITTYLKSFIEPNANSSKSAYLYNGNNLNEWSKGISNVKTVKNSDGGYTVSFTIKEEKNDPKYHNGFLSVLNSKSINQDGLVTEEVTIKASNVTATIAPDYILKSYSATAPFSGKFSLSMTADESASEGGASINKGDEITFKIPINGDAAFTYNFTR